MALQDHIWREPAGRNRTRDVDFRGCIPLGATGALGTGASAPNTPAFTLTKVGGKTGRYLVQLIDSRGQPIVAPSAQALVFGSATVETATADAAYTTAKAAYGLVRNNTVSTTGSFQIQMVRSDTVADAEVEDNGKIHLSFSVKFSSVVP